MRRVSVLITICWLALPGIVAPLPVLAAQHERLLPTNPGREYFMQYCAACHGEDARGHGPVAPALRTPPADLRRIAERRGGNFPEAEIASYIDGQLPIRAHGTREMPVWGERFSEQFGGGTVGQEFARGHVHVLLRYLKSIQQ